MAYKLYTDKQETFECDLYLEGANLKDSSARNAYFGEEFKIN